MKTSTLRLSSSVFAVAFAAAASTAAARAVCVESGSSVVLAGRIMADPAASYPGSRAVRLSPDRPFCIKSEFEGRPRQQAASLVPADGAPVIDDPEGTWVRVSGRVFEENGPGLVLRYQSVHRFR
jgi:hypothetical protein